MSQFVLESAEFERRQAAMRTELTQRGLDGLIVFTAQRVYYLCGFVHKPSERPVALVLPVDGDAAILVPKLEEEHVTARASTVRRVEAYAEYPGLKHPMQHLADLLNSLGLADSLLGADRDGSEYVMGYRGPALSEIVGGAITILRDLIDDMRLVKSPAELAVMRTSGQWAVKTHRLLQEQMVTDQTEIEISQQAERLAADQLAGVLVDAGHLGGAATVHASFRAGPRTAMPHAMMGNRPTQSGDNMVSYCLGQVAGYHTELERTMFLGQPTDRQREFFNVVQEAQQAVFDTLRPGLRCADVERAMRDFLVSRGYEEFIRHHTGHGLGLEAHESPFLDLGDQTEMKPGMVLSVEPGLYVPGLGGFRHSDTVALTDSGVEVLTEYPRDLNDLIID